MRTIKTNKMMKRLAIMAVLLTGAFFVPNTLRAQGFKTLSKFVKIPAGEFKMGSDKKPNEKPVHHVKISNDYWMQTTEVTQTQWKTVMSRNPSLNKCANCPVENVRWNNEFINAVGPKTIHKHLEWDSVSKFISKLNKANDGYEYRLPTEAEWEYAARTGTKENSKAKIDSIAWYRENSGGKTHPVGQKSPNDWGLYDMYGNVAELMNDTYGRYQAQKEFDRKNPDYYLIIDPTGPAPNSIHIMRNNTKVQRGGGFNAHPSTLTPTSRSTQSTGKTNGWVGFRLVREIKKT